MLEKQQTMQFTAYEGLYEAVVPKENLLRQIEELIDFQFIYEELEEKYCLNNGRNAISPIRLFKYLLLKVLFDLSDVDVVERSKYDMSYKYFLGMTPEEKVIHPSTLTKYRKLRLKDMKLLDLLIGKTVAIAMEKEILNSSSILVDSTHTRARYNQQTPVECLREKTKQLRKAVYQIDEGLKEHMPAKNRQDNLKEEMEYSQKLLEELKEQEPVCRYPKVREKMNRLEEILKDDQEQLAQRQSSEDRDARIGHKTADTSFFGYKTHLAMSEERLITAAVVTTGEAGDGKQLKELYEKSKAAGMEIDTIIGDGAYSGRNNIELAKENGVKLVAKMISAVTQQRSKEDWFEYNKDAGMFVCKAGHMSYMKTQQGQKRDYGKRWTYYFHVNKCRCCPLQEGCYRGGPTKTYSVSIRSDLHQEQWEYQKSDGFKEKAKERYKIEAKNSELKNRHGYGVASGSGLVAMQLQGAMSIFAVNIKRILQLMREA